MKYFFIVILLSALNVYHRCSDINYQYITKDQIKVNEITSSFEINHNTTGFISENKHLYTCNSSENSKCDILVSTDKNLFAVTNNEIFTSISNHNITIFDSQTMKPMGSFQMESDETTAASYLNKDTLITASFKDNIVSLNTIKHTLSKNTNTLIGHTDRVTTLLQLSNGMLVSGSDDKTMIVWDPSNNYSLVTTLIGHTSGVTSILQLSNGMFASGSDDNNIIIWNTKKKYSLVIILVGHTNWISSLLQLSNGMLVSGSGDKTMKIWNPNDNYSLVTTLTGHKDRVSSLLQLSNGMLVSGSDDSTIKVWNPKTNYSLVTTLTGHSNWVSSLLQLSNGMLVSGDGDGSMKVWDPKNNYSLVTTLTGHTDVVISLLQLSNGMLVSGSYDSTIKVWDINNNYSLVTTLTKHTDWVTSLFQLSNKMLLSASGDFSIKMWDSNKNYSLVTTLTGHKDRVNTILQLSNGMLASGSDDNNVKIWNTSEISINSQKVTHPQKINKLLTFNEQTVITSSSESICKYKYNKDNSNFELQECKSVTGNVSLLKLNENTFLSSHSNGNIYYWDVDKFDTVLNKEISALINKSDTKQLLYITQIMKKNSGELIAALNTNHVIVLNESNLELLFKHDHSADSNIVSIIGVGKDKFVSVSSDGLLHTFSDNPSLHLNNKKITGNIDL
jgi:WD40 repeat protein